MITVILFVLTLVAALASAIFLAPILMPEASRGATKLIFMLPVFLVGSGITWLVGGYQEK